MSASRRGVGAAYALGLAALAAALVAGALLAAGHEWFSRDDFAFLAHVQLTEPWSWARVFLPLEERFWPFYRPLSMETFFWVGHRLFGLRASGFFALSLGLHFLTAWPVYRLCRQLAFDPRVAAATAFLTVSRPGTLDEIYYGSVFMYVGVVFFGALAATSFLDALRGGGWRAAGCALAAALLALLCNEVAVTLPAWLLGLALASGRARLGAGGWRPLGAALAPMLLLVALYLGFRLLVIAPAAAPSVYAPTLGAHLLPNAAYLLAWVFGGFAPLALALALFAALAAAAASDAGARRWLGRVGAGTGVWLAALVLPFASLPFPQERWAMPLAAPACVALGAALEAFRRARAPRALEAALLALLVLAFPLSALREHVRAPLGSAPRGLVQWIDAQRPPLSPRAVLVVLYGAPGLADAQQAERFRYLAYGGGVLNAVYPKAQRVMRFHDVAQRARRNAIRPDSVYLALDPDLRVRAAPPALLDRWLRRRFQPARAEGPATAEGGTPFVVARRGRR